MVRTNICRKQKTPHTFYHSTKCLKISSPAGVVRFIDGYRTMTTENFLVLDARQTAGRLGLSVSTLAKMRLYGTGPVYSKLGRRVMYRPEDLKAWIAANRYQSTSEYPAKSG